MRSPLAHAIREARLTVRLTQQQLGSRLGLKGRAIYRWERDDSAPRRRHRRALVTALQVLDPAAASKLQAVFESLERKPRRAPVATQAAPPPPAPPTGEVALELATFAMAEELDVTPRRLRAALAKFLARAAQAQFSLESARRHMHARWAGQEPAAGALPPLEAGS